MTAELTGTRSRRRPWTVRRQLQVFVAVGLLLLIVVSVGAVLSTRQVARAEALSDAETVTRRLADLVVAPLLGDALAGDPARRAELDRAVDLRLQDGSVSEVTVWRADGTILYADEAALIGRTFPPSPEVIAAIERGETSTGVEESDEAGALPADQRYLEVYVPITVAGERLAFEAYLSAARLDSQSAALSGRIVTLVMLPLIVLLAVQLPIAASLARRIGRQEAERSGLLERALSASDRERRAIAADLHDGVVQDLAGAGYALAALVPSVSEERRPIAESVGTTVRSAVDALRRLMVEIYPPDLTGPGLANALGDLARPLRDQGVEVRIDVSPLPPLTPEAAATVYRLARETLTNAAKHADARAVRVELGPVDDGSPAGPAAVCLRVCDDGVGLPPGALDRRREGHFGLRILADRVADLGGRFSIGPGADGGTVAEAMVPTRAVT